MNIITDMSHRSTTVAADEPICLATLLGMQLEKFDGDPTMVKIYSSYATIPEDIIFIQAPRLQDDGYRWAPFTLLNRNNQAFEPSMRKGLVASSGFHLRKNGILLRDFYYDNTPYNHYYILSSEQQVKWTFEGPVEPQNTRDVDQPSRRICRPAIIINKSEDKLPLTSWGVLVSGVEKIEDKETYSCKFEMVVMMHRWTEETSSILRARTQPDGLAEREGWKGPFYLDGCFKLDLGWCVQ
jgi:hypothetical protein